MEVRNYHNAMTFLVVKDERGIYRTPLWSRENLPGLSIQVDHTCSMGKQLVHSVIETLPEYELESDDVLITRVLGLAGKDDHNKTMVFLGTIPETRMTAPTSWPSVAEVLQSMDKNRQRLPYLRAFQWLMGVADNEIMACVADDELMRQIRELES